MEWTLLALSLVNLGLVLIVYRRAAGRKAG